MTGLSQLGDRNVAGLEDAVQAERCACFFVPPLDAVDQAGASRLDLRGVLTERALQLGPPELRVDPPGEVLRPAGVDAPSFTGPRGLDPRAPLPAEAGERTDRPRFEELVGDHDCRRFQSRNARSSSASASGGTSSSRSFPATVRVFRIWSM